MNLATAPAGHSAGPCIRFHEIPRYIVFVEEFPMTLTGRVQKFVMRARMTELLGLSEVETA